MRTARPATDSLPVRLFQLFGAGLVLAVLLLAAGAARAADERDAPGRVGRIADLQGQVWVFGTETGEWLAAERNAVLTTGDRIATDAGARAELRVGSTTVRLDGGSELEFIRLDDERIDLRVHSGSAALRVRNRDKLRELSVATGEGRFTFQRTGRYRIDRPDDASHLTVYAGQALYEGPRSALTVNAGQRAEFWIDSAGAAQYSITDPVRDAFAAWTGERDRAEDRSASTRYVSPEMTGVEELDRHGRWEESDDYGPLWIPHGVAPGWAPYSTGRWAWVRPWGWTWVDEAPWGFAPFHYGRWVHFRGSWSWSPGQRVLQPVFAPALVAWVGGPNFSLSINLGGGPAVGWFPLAPREVYVPGYYASPVYVRNVNVTHVTNVTIINNAVRQPPNPYDLRYRKFPNAVTVVPATVVTNRQSVSGPARQLRDTPVARQIVERPTGAGGNAFVAPVATPATPPRGSFDASTVRPPGRSQVGPGTPQGRVQTAPRAEPAERETRDDRTARPPREGRPERDGADRPARPVRPINPVPPPPTPAPAVGPTRPAGRPAPPTPPLGQSLAPSDAAPAAPTSRPVARPAQRPPAQPAPSDTPPAAVVRPGPPIGQAQSPRVEGPRPNNGRATAEQRADRLRDAREPREPREPRDERKER